MYRYIVVTAQALRISIDTDNDPTSDPYRRYRYRPLVERADYVVGESRRFMDRLFGGKLTPLVAHLAERDAITDQDIAEIEALLKELKS